MVTGPASRGTLPLAALVQIVGSDNVRTDDATRKLYSCDLYFWPDAPLADAVVQPGSVQEVAAILALARREGLAVAPRGGGMSYTGGYVPSRPGTLLLDLSRLNAIHEISEVDCYVTAGAAVTWQQIDDALRPRGLRPVMRGPISGTHATLGGIASQNTGSASMASFLSLEVVLADGRILHTGSAGMRDVGVPHSRCYGPDLTGLFLGDTGAFGVKTGCTLAIEPIPPGVAFASIGFDTLTALAEVMTRIGRSGIGCRMLAMDSFKNRSVAKVGVFEGLATLTGVVKSADTVISGLRRATEIAASGRRVLDDVSWSLHLIVEGHDQMAADGALDALRPHWATRGRGLPPSVAAAMHGRPYSMRGVVGPRGERWIPIHGIFPPSRIKAAIDATEAFFDQNAERLAEHGIEHSFIMTSSGASLLLEPMFYWSDELGPLHAIALASKYVRFADAPQNFSARAVVIELRRQLAELFRRLGAAHSQIGKFYEFAGNLEPDTYAVLEDIKRLLDSRHILNPGNLGFK